MTRAGWRAIIASTCVLAVGLTGATWAGAAKPTKDELQVIPYGFSVDCGPYDFGFENVVKGRETLWTQTFFDPRGNPVRIVVHDSFAETDTNSVSGKALSVSGRTVTTYDLVAGTRTVVGKEFLMTGPGSGAVIHDVGRVGFDAPFHVSVEAGRHDVLHGDVDQLACRALANA